ncbi:FAD-dependent oxidoreductase [Nocardia anaemiae]|uniref:FAD-dependent oxidoreductase n=1 Tax=Nocardia anaemiae TaxID=263910 RepID=UPI0007A4FBC3|nr:FAD-dependent oxidoreductase [Nocardia anaemiae]
MFEALDRVGGRVDSANTAQALVGLGGTFIGPDQDRILALADEAGVGRYPTHESGDNLILWRKELKRYRGLIPPIGGIGLLDLARVRSSFERLSRKIPVGRPWDAPNAADLDAQTLGSWLVSKRACQSTHDMMAVVCKTSWAVLRSAQCDSWRARALKSPVGGPSVTLTNSTRHYLGNTVFSSALG